MIRKPLFSPSMMCADIMRLGETVSLLESAGAAMLHIDVMDGVFVQNVALGTDYINQLRKSTKLPLDIHLMIDRPEEKLSWFEPHQGEYISIHVESTPHIQRALSMIRSFGAHPIAALNPGTPLETLEEILPDVDGVLIMCVNPGFAGQQLVPSAIGKIGRLRQTLDKSGYASTLIEVDGNVSFANLPIMYQAGADVFVCGTSSIFSARGTIMQNMQAINQLLQNTRKE